VRALLKLPPHEPDGHHAVIVQVGYSLPQRLAHSRLPQRPAAAVVASSSAADTRCARSSRSFARFAISSALSLAPFAALPMAPTAHPGIPSSARTIATSRPRSSTLYV